jgi:hypothetical protein
MGNISNAERARRAAALPESEQDAQAEADAAEQVTEQEPVTDQEAAAPETESAEVAAEPAPEPDLTGLIKVSKNGEVLHVHPSALQQHKQLGWLEI